jgi:Tfp pilus assembly PilM family ATPase
MKQEMGIPVEQLNPFRRIHAPEASAIGETVSEQGPRLSVAVGLALRSFEDL